MTREDRTTWHVEDGVLFHGKYVYAQEFPTNPARLEDLAAMLNALEPPAAPVTATMSGNDEQTCEAWWKDGLYCFLPVNHSGRHAIGPAWLPSDPEGTWHDEVSICALEQQAKRVPVLEQAFKDADMRASKAERDLYLLQQEQGCDHDWAVVGNGGPNQDRPIEWMGRWIQWCTQCTALSWYDPHPAALTTTDTEEEAG